MTTTIYYDHHDGIATDWLVYSRYSFTGAASKILSKNVTNYCCYYCCTSVYVFGKCEFSIFAELLLPAFCQLVGWLSSGASVTISPAHEALATGAFRCRTSMMFMGVPPVVVARRSVASSGWIWSILPALLWLSTVIMQSCRGFDLLWLANRGSHQHHSRSINSSNWCDIIILWHDGKVGIQKRKLHSLVWRDDDNSERLWL